MYELDKTGGAVFSLHYHLITVVKYRKKVFTNEEMISDLKTIIQTIAKDFDVTIIEQECGTDHIHILFKSKPTLNVTKFINILKGHSSRKLRDKYKDFLKDKLWGDSFWSPSYFLATTGNVTVDTLKKYVENQRTFQE
jgi:putative transposase